MKKITVAFGAHEQATAALRWAAGLAQIAHAPLEVVNVFAPNYSEVSPDWYDELAAERREQIELVVKDFADLRSEVIVLKGHEPIEELARFLDRSS